MFLLFLFFILSCSSNILVNAQVKLCSGVQKFKNPNDGNNILWYPFPFNDSNVPLLPDNDKCQFEINVAQGYSARVILSLNSTNPSGISQPPVQITSQFQKNEQFSSADELYFYFTAPGGAIKLDTQNGKVQFGFSVDWMPYNTEQGSPVHVNQTDTSPYMLSIGAYLPFTVTADTRVAMTVISYPYDFYYTLFRGVLIFDGPNINSTCLGTAYDIYTGNTQFVSTGNTMTIQILNRPNGYMPQMLFWQDYENTKNIQQFQGMACKSGGYCGVYSLDATKGPVALQSIYAGNYYEPEVLTDFEGTGTLNVYIGGVTKDGKNVQATYDAKNSAAYLPQTFRGPLKTYVLMNGKATLNITRDPDQFAITKSFGRKGFIVSSNNGNGQGAYGQIQAPIGYSDAQFNVKIVSVDLSGDAWLEITGSKNGTDTSDENFNSTYLPDMENGYTINGDTLTIEYSSQTLNTTRFYLTFEVVGSLAPDLFSPFMPFLIAFVFSH